MRKKFSLLLFCSALVALAADKEHATLVREATLYVSPGSTSEKLVHVERGRDLIILERTNIDNNQPWVKVYVTLVDLEKERVRELTGWLPMKGVIATSTPSGDQIIFPALMSIMMVSCKPSVRVMAFSRRCILSPR